MSFVGTICDIVDKYLTEEAKTFIGQQGCEILDFVNGEMIVRQIIGWREVNMDESDLGASI